MAATPDPTGTVEKMCVDNETLSDWTIVSEEGQRLPCHRVILAAKSSTMKAMMTIETRGKEAKETKIHHNNQVEDAAIKTLNIENVIEMFSLASVCHAGTLEEATEIFIVENKKILGQQDLSQIPPSVMTEVFKIVTQS